MNQETPKAESPKGITITATRDGWEPIDEYYEDTEEGNEKAMKRLSEIRNNHIKELVSLRMERDSEIARGRRVLVFDSAGQQIPYPEPQLKVEIIVQ